MDKKIVFALGVVTGMAALTAMAFASDGLFDSASSGTSDEREDEEESESSHLLALPKGRV